MEDPWVIEVDSVMVEANMVLSDSVTRMRPGGPDGRGGRQAPVKFLRQ